MNDTEDRTRRLSAAFDLIDQLREAGFVLRFTRAGSVLLDKKKRPMSAIQFMCLKDNVQNLDAELREIFPEAMVNAQQLDRMHQAMALLKRAEHAKMEYRRSEIDRRGYSHKQPASDLEHYLSRQVDFYREEVCEILNRGW